MTKGTNKMIRVFMIDDHQLFVSGIRSIFEGDEEIQIVGACHDGSSAMSQLSENQPIDVILLDINLPGMDGVALNQLIRQNFPACQVIALTMHQESVFIQKMIKGGARGYVLKNSGKDHLKKAILAVAEGGTFFGDDVKEALMQEMMPGSASKSIPKLSRREKEVLLLITREHTTAEIAEKLFISQNTVETHRKNLLQKLNVRNTAGLVRLAMEKGLVE
jgi:DNA-binding NarL/FixJ family response regulator